MQPILHQQFQQGQRRGFVAGSHGTFPPRQHSSRGVVKHDGKGIDVSSLPITAHREEVIHSVLCHPITVIQGETGCGKSSQVPKYLMQAWDEFGSGRNTNSSSGDSVLGAGGGGYGILGRGGMRGGGMGGGGPAGGPVGGPAAYAMGGQQRLLPNPSIECNMYVTQPRRIAAISLAKRLAEELGEQLGDSVGYRIGQDAVINRGARPTRICFVTTGWLLQRLMFDTNFFQDCTHIVLDEMHERSIDSDLLYLLVRSLLRQMYTDMPGPANGNPLPLNRGRLRLVCMSATIDCSMFSDYFRVGNFDVPQLFVGVKRYPVDTVFLERLMDHPLSAGARFPLNQPSLERAARQVEDGVPEVSEVMQSTCIALLWHLAALHRGDPSPAGNCILVFLPGIAEIESMYRVLQDMTVNRVDAGGCDHVETLVLHSTIEHDDQMKVFEPIPSGTTRIILSTNMAESSVTIPEVRYVVDFGLSRQLEYEAKTGLTLLATTWISRASAQQRAGRCGRLFPGTVFRMYTSHFFQQMPAYDVPEMVRMSLNSTVLRLKQLSEMVEADSPFSNPRAALHSALQPPEDWRVDAAVHQLIACGALEHVIDASSASAASSTMYGQKRRRPDTLVDTRMSHLGRFLLNVPMDIHFGRLVALGARAGRFIMHALVVAAGMSVPELFVLPHPSAGPVKFSDLSARTQAGRQKYAVEGSCSDALSMINIFRDHILHVQKYDPTLSMDARNRLIQAAVNLVRLNQFNRTLSEIAARLMDVLPMHIEWLALIAKATSGSASQEEVEQLHTELEMNEDDRDFVSFLLAGALMENGIIFGQVGWSTTNLGLGKRGIVSETFLDLMNTVVIKDVPECLFPSGALDAALGPALKPHIRRVSTCSDPSWPSLAQKKELCLGGGSEFESGSAQYRYGPIAVEFSSTNDPNGPPPVILSSTAAEFTPAGVVTITRPAQGVNSALKSSVTVAGVKTSLSVEEQKQKNGRSEWPVALPGFGASCFISMFTRQLLSLPDISPTAHPGQVVTLANPSKASKVSWTLGGRAACSLEQRSLLSSLGAATPTDHGSYVYGVAASITLFQHGARVDRLTLLSQRTGLLLAALLSGCDRFGGIKCFVSRGEDGQEWIRALQFGDVQVSATPIILDPPARVSILSDPLFLNWRHRILHLLFVPVASEPDEGFSPQGLSQLKGAMQFPTSPSGGALALVSNPLITNQPGVTLKTQRKSATERLTRMDAMILKVAACGGDVSDLPPIQRVNQAPANPSAAAAGGMGAAEGGGGAVVDRVVSKPEREMVNFLFELTLRMSGVVMLSELGCQFKSLTGQKLTDACKPFGGVDTLCSNHPTLLRFGGSGNQQVVYAAGHFPPELSGGDSWMTGEGYGGGAGTGMVTVGGRGGRSNILASGANERMAAEFLLQIIEAPPYLGRARLAEIGDMFKVRYGEKLTTVLKKFGGIDVLCHRNSDILCFFRESEMFQVILSVKLCPDDVAACRRRDRNGVTDLILRMSAADLGRPGAKKNGANGGVAAGQLVIAQQDELSGTGGVWRSVVQKNGHVKKFYLPVTEDDVVRVLQQILAEKQGRMTINEMSERFKQITNEKFTAYIKQFGNLDRLASRYPDKIFIHSAEHTVYDATARTGDIVALRELASYKFKGKGSSPNHILQMPEEGVFPGGIAGFIVRFVAAAGGRCHLSEIADQYRLQTGDSLGSALKPFKGVEGMCARYHGILTWDISPDHAVLIVLHNPDIFVSALQMSVMAGYGRAPPVAGPSAHSKSSGVSNGAAAVGGKGRGKFIAGGGAAEQNGYGGGRGGGKNTFDSKKKQMYPQQQQQQQRQQHYQHEDDPYRAGGGKGLLQQEHYPHPHQQQPQSQDIFSSFAHQQQQLQQQQQQQQQHQSREYFIAQQQQQHQQQQQQFGFQQQPQYQQLQQQQQFQPQQLQQQHQFPMSLAQEQYSLPRHQQQQQQQQQFQSLSSFQGGGGQSSSVLGGGVGNAGGYGAHPFLQQQSQQAQPQQPQQSQSGFSNPEMMQKAAFGMMMMMGNGQQGGVFQQQQQQQQQQYAAFYGGGAQQQQSQQHQPGNAFQQFAAQFQQPMQQQSAFFDHAGGF